MAKVKKDSFKKQILVGNKRRDQMAKGRNKPKVGDKKPAQLSIKEKRKKKKDKKKNY